MVLLHEAKMKLVASSSSADDGQNNLVGPLSISEFLRLLCLATGGQSDLQMTMVPESASLAITYSYASGCVAAHSLDRRHHLHRHDCRQILHYSGNPHHQTQIEGARLVATQSHQDPCHPLSHPTN